MSATTPTPDKPRRCPRCGRSYAFRVRSRIDHEMNLVRHFRCVERAGYVYVHEIATSGPTPTRRDPPIDAAAYHALLVD